MLSKIFTVFNAEGLHMRPAGIFASEMGNFDCTVKIRFKGREINAKSLMNIMAACIKRGSQFELVCDGSDEQAAMDKASDLILSGFE